MTISSTNQECECRTGGCATTADGQNIDFLTSQIRSLESLVEVLGEVVDRAKVRESRLEERIDEQAQILTRIDRRMIDLPVENERRTAPPQDERRAVPIEKKSAAERQTKTVSEEADNHYDEVVGLGTASFLRDWQKQRDEMLGRLSNPPPAETPVENHTETTVSKEQAVDSTERSKLNADLSALSSEDREEIEALKARLNKALMDAEVELSKERAKLSNERLAVERKAEELERREKSLAQREKVLAGGKDARVSRLKQFLGGGRS